MVTLLAPAVRHALTLSASHLEHHAKQVIAGTHSGIDG
jgi:hypothetical protein